MDPIQKNSASVSLWSPDPSQHKHTKKETSRATVQGGILLQERDPRIQSTQNSTHCRGGVQHRDTRSRSTQNTPLTTTSFIGHREPTFRPRVKEILSAQGSPSPLSPNTHSFRLTDREVRFARRVVLKYIKNEEDAEDATQNALLLALTHAGDFRGESRFTTWLYRIAVTSALMFLRKHGRAPQRISMSEDQDEEIHDLPSPLPSPEETASYAETMAAYEQALNTLDVKYKEVFHLRFMEGYTETEAAHALGLTVGTVKTRAHRARLRMRALLALTQPDLIPVTEEAFEKAAA